MRYFLIFLLLNLGILSARTQSCDDVMNFVKSKSYGTTYTSYNSTAISKVTFYEIMIDYQNSYFAIVCFKRKYSYGCTEYIYQVGARTKYNYSINYLSSAGKAFWKYIQPYHKILGCGPDLDEDLDDDDE